MIPIEKRKKNFRNSTSLSDKYLEPTLALKRPSGILQSHWWACLLTIHQDCKVWPNHTFSCAMRLPPEIDLNSALKAFSSTKMLTILQKAIIVPSWNYCPQPVSLMVQNTCFTMLLFNTRVISYPSGFSTYICSE